MPISIIISKYFIQFNLLCKKTNADRDAIYCVSIIFDFLLHANAHEKPIPSYILSPQILYQTIQVLQERVYKCLHGLAKQDQFC